MRKKEGVGSNATEEYLLILPPRAWCLLGCLENMTHCQVFRNWIENRNHIEIPTQRKDYKYGDQGIEIVITNRGKSVAKIVAINNLTLSLAGRVNDLEMPGIIEEKKSLSKPLPPPIPVLGEIAQKFLQESRHAFIHPCSC